MTDKTEGEKQQDVFCYKGTDRKLYTLKTKDMKSSESDQGFDNKKKNLLLHFCCHRKCCNPYETYAITQLPANTETFEVLLQMYYYDQLNVLQ